MRIFKDKWFSRYARRAGIEDADLCRAVIQANQGIVDADLGGGVIKQRIARPGEEKSGGFRTIVLFKISDLAVFVCGFAKNERSNVQADELMAFRKLATEVLAYDAAAVTRVIEAGAFTEVFCEAEGEGMAGEVVDEQAV